MLPASQSEVDNKKNSNAQDLPIFWRKKSNFIIELQK
jgi:hypothetical protein